MYTLQDIENDIKFFENVKFNLSIRLSDKLKKGTFLTLYSSVNKKPVVGIKTVQELASKVQNFLTKHHCPYILKDPICYDQQYNIFVNNGFTEEYLFTECFSSKDEIVEYLESIIDETRDFSKIIIIDTINRTWEKYSYRTN